MPNTCLTCQSYITSTGECHRYPPTLVLQGVSHIALWPVVSAEDWCNEYAASTSGGSGLELTSLSPSSLPAGSTPATITVTGAGFDDTCSVYINGQSRSTFFISTTELQYTARPDLQTSPTTVQVTVQNSAGDTSNALPFSFT